MKPRKLMLKTGAAVCMVTLFGTGLTAFTLPEDAALHISEIIPTKIEAIAKDVHKGIMLEAKSRRAAEETTPEAAKPETVEEMIARYCAEYGVEYRLAIAIARLETGHFTSAAYLQGNNVGGLSVKEIPLTFSTREEGVKAFVENLTTYYAAGLTTPEAIQPVYCPGNENWTAVVRQLMQ